MKKPLHCIIGLHIHTYEDREIVCISIRCSDCGHHMCAEDGRMIEMERMYWNLHPNARPGEIRKLLNEFEYGLHHTMAR